MGLFVRTSGIRGKRGFTLAELLIVVTIISVLVIMSLVTFSNQTRRARDERRQADLEQIRSALELYRLTQANRTYPNVEGEPHAVLNTFLPTFLSSIPRDPWSSNGVQYYYRSTSPFYTYELCAHMERGTGGALCTGGSATCGTGFTCNYRATQP